jgi:hypothetical protein
MNFIGLCDDKAPKCAATNGMCQVTLFAHFPLCSIFLLVVCASFLSCPNVFGQDKKVFYGGFAFAGNASEIEKNYPVALKLNATDAQSKSLFEAQAKAFFTEHASSFSKIDLQFGLARPEDTSLVLALALTDEKVLREQLGSFHKLVIQLGFELLVLDFRTMEVAVSRPIYIELIDASRDSFSADDVVARMRGMIEGNSSQLFTAILEKSGDFQIRGKNQSTLQIRTVSIGEKALPFLPDAYRQSTTTYAQAIAQQFGALLAGKAGLAMLPYAKDALNSKMSLRFADASMLQFRIPSPTFAVDVDLKGYKKILDKSTPAESLWLYGAFLGIRVYEPEFNKVFFDAPVKFGAPKVVPASQQTVDEFPIVSEALQGAFLEAIQQMQKDKNTSTKVLNKCKL